MVGSAVRHLESPPNSPDKKARLGALRVIDGGLDQLGEGAGATVDSLRAQAGELLGKLSPFISTESQKGYQDLTRGQEMKVTVDMLRNHPEFFKSKMNERAQALRTYNTIQKALEEGHIGRTQADELVQEHVLNKMSAEFMKGSLEFAQDYMRMVDQLMKPVLQAQKEGYISETDVAYYQKEYIQKNELTLKQDFTQIQSHLAGVLKNRKDGKAKYDAAMQHPAIEGKCKITFAGDLNKFFNEKAFLKATVPERKAFYKALEAALSLWDAQTEAYQSRVKNAVKSRWMNKETAQQFVQEFADLDETKRSNWLENMSEWNKRELLRGEVKKLKGENRAYMEEMFEALGYTEFKSLFDKNQKAHESYVLKLKGFKKDKHYGLRQSTYAEYLDWAEKQSYPVLEKALSELSSFNQMGRFAELQKRLDDLNHLDEAQRAELEKKYNPAGYEERKRLIEAAELSQRDDSGAHELNPLLDANNKSVLSGVSNTVLRKGLLHGLSTLMSMGRDKFKQFANMIGRVFGGRNVDKVKTFDQGVAAGRAKFLAEDLEEEKIDITGPSQQLKITQLELALKQKRQFHSSPQLHKEEPSSFNVDVDESDLIESLQKEDLADHITALEREDGVDVVRVSGFQRIETDDGEEDAAFINVNDTEAGLRAALDGADKIGDKTAVTLGASTGSGNVIELKGPEKKGFVQLVEELNKAA